MLGAGKRDRKIAFERAGSVDDGYNVRKDWSDPETVAAPFAAVRYGTSAERRQAASEQASQTATFRVLATSRTRAVTEGDRIVFDGREWNIEGIAPIGRTEIEFTATTRRG